MRRMYKKDRGTRKAYLKNRNKSPEEGIEVLAITLHHLLFTPQFASLVAKFTAKQIHAQDADEFVCANDFQTCE